MNKLIPIAYLIIGLVFIAQGAGVLPLLRSVSRGIPMICGWIFIVLGVIMTWKLSRTKPREMPQEKAETPKEQTKEPEEPVSC